MILYGTSTTSFPLGTDGIFPDNGILSQAYDKRVSQNDMLKVAMQLMHHADAYYREEKLDGTGQYTWNQDFITLLQESMSSGLISNMSRKQRILFDKYVRLLTDGIIGNETEDVLELDKYIGGLK